MRRESVSFLAGITLVLWAALPAAAGSALPLDEIRLPAGFHIEVFARVPGARSMTLSPDGVLYVGTRDEGKVYALSGAGGGRHPAKVVTIARGLDMPNGVAWRGGDLYVAEVSRILRFDDIDQRFDHPPQPVVVRDDYPDRAHHGWKFIAFGPDGRLYVPIGAPCNVCNRPGFGVITRLNPDGGGREIYAEGIRNTVGFDWNPVTRVLWFTDNGRDHMGDDLPPDELNRAPRSGMNFGFPFCHGGDVPDPEFGRQAPCSRFTPPVLKLGAHVAALGMRFYTGRLFPPEYRNRIFIAEHGSWDRSVPVGYRVISVEVRDGKAVDKKPFAEGWLQDGSAWGRPVDVQVMHDGALLISDDLAGAIYRISYRAD
ncbi:MAG: sorbosone dehydrogenase family protein [Arenicellales bacterium]